ncbi:hypothetical protein [Morganella morganii]|uniref:hypothetical protein n=1 Tax=Morganella morganii TaxID=582 RepID=UPI0032AF092B
MDYLDELEAWIMIPDHRGVKPVYDITTAQEDGSTELGDFLPDSMTFFEAGFIFFRG